jgi:hypothetical protein
VFEVLSETEEQWEAFRGLPVAGGPGCRPGSGQ